MEKSNQAAARRSYRNEEVNVRVLVRRGSADWQGHEHFAGRQSHPTLTTLPWDRCAAWEAAPVTEACGFGFPPLPLTTFWFSLLSTWCKGFSFHRSSMLAQWCGKHKTRGIIREGDVTWTCSSWAEPKRNGVLSSLLVWLLQAFLFVSVQMPAFAEMRLMPCIAGK